MNNSILSNIEGVLSRDEMKHIMAGDFCGNIYCNTGGTQTWQGSGCGDEVMISALDNCELLAALDQTTCNGCARFA